MNTGMSSVVYVVYFNTLGTLILLPYFIVLTNRSNQPPLTFSLLCRFFVLGLVGYVDMAGIDYSSPTLGAAMGNLIPAFTFLLAIIFSCLGSNQRGEHGGGLESSTERVPLLQT